MKLSFEYSSKCFIYLYISYHRFIILCPCHRRFWRILFLVCLSRTLTLNLTFEWSLIKFSYFMCVFLVRRALFWYQNYLLQYGCICVSQTYLVYNMYRSYMIEEMLKSICFYDTGHQRHTKTGGKERFPPHSRLFRFGDHDSWNKWVYLWNGRQNSSNRRNQKTVQWRKLPSHGRQTQSPTDTGL